MAFDGKDRRRVGLFGGSFNPPHIGHTVICRWLFKQGLVDELWVIPCFRHPLGKKLESFEHRLTMCRLAFLKLALPISIIDVEQKLGGVSYTLRTVEHLKGEYPHLRFLLVTGDDVQEQVGKWKEFGKIRKLVEVIRVPRGGGSPIPSVSSTFVRERMEHGKPYSDLVEREVAVYIITKGLFR